MEVLFLANMSYKSEGHNHKWLNVICTNGHYNTICDFLITYEIQNNYGSWTKPFFFCSGFRPVGWSKYSLVLLPCSVPSCHSPSLPSYLFIGCPTVEMKHWNFKFLPEGIFFPSSLLIWTVSWICLVLDDDYMSYNKLLEELFPKVLCNTFLSCPSSSPGQHILTYSVSFS